MQWGAASEQPTAPAQHTQNCLTCRHGWGMLSWETAACVDGHVGQGGFLSAAVLGRAKFQRLFGVDPKSPWVGVSDGTECLLILAW